MLSNVKALLGEAEFVQCVVMAMHRLRFASCCEGNVWLRPVRLRRAMVM